MGPKYLSIRSDDSCVGEAVEEEDDLDQQEPKYPEAVSADDSYWYGDPVAE